MDIQESLAKGKIKTLQLIPVTEVTYKNHTHQHELLNILHRNLPFTFPGSPLKYSNMMGPRNKIYHREIKADM